MKKISIIGSQGVPAQYGGFESLVEYLIGEHMSDDIQYTVFCSGKDMKVRLDTYKGAILRYVNLHANGCQSILYDIISMIKASRGSDCILILGVSGCAFLPIFRLFSKIRLVINIDGQEYKRQKWNKFAKKLLKYSEKMAIKYADIIIADNKGIADYVKDEYGKDATLIAYGGDHVLKDEVLLEEDILSEFGLKAKDYAISVCRIEPENNCHVILDAFSKSEKNLIFIGNWDKSEYGRCLKQKYSPYKNIIIHDSVYDLNTLYVLRRNASMYIHGHSAGGTNPSLVEAMFFGIPIIAYDVVYNRETTEYRADYFSNSEELLKVMSETSQTGEYMKFIAQRRYCWKTIVNQYEQTYFNAKIIMT